MFVVQFTDCFDTTYNGLKITQSTLKLVMMDHGSEVEDESFRESQSETQFEIELRVTPLLSFTSGSAFGNHSDNNNILTEPLRPVNLGKIAESGRHNSKKANTLKKPETSSDSAKGKKEELTDLLTERRTNGTSVKPLQENSPKQQRRLKIGLMRSLSSNSEAMKETSHDVRRLSDPTLSSQEKSPIIKETLERRGSLKKLLKKKAASPLYLFGKVASCTGSKLNQDIDYSQQFKDNKKTALPKRLYPSLSKALEPSLALTRRGSDPCGTRNQQSICDSPMQGYGKDENDSSRQINGGLAINTDREKQEFQADWGSKMPICNYSAETGTKGNDSLGIVSDKQTDVHLKEVLKQVLTSHILKMDDYSLPKCDRLGRSVCKIITRLFGGAIKTTDRQQKITCLVYIGAVKDNGIHIATQALCCPAEDIFTTASFRNESVFGMAVVIVVPA